MRALGGKTQRRPSGEKPPFDLLTGRREGIPSPFFNGEIKDKKTSTREETPEVREAARKEGWEKDYGIRRQLQKRALN